MLTLKRAFLFSSVVLGASAVSAFDTSWHSDAVRKAAAGFGFSEDAIKIMQLGNFSVDFFGPVSEYATAGFQQKEMDALRQYLGKNLENRQASIFLHFDNLHGELETNARIDSILNRLLQNTQRALADLSKRSDADERTRKVLI